MGTTALISIMLKLRHRSQSVGSTEVRNNRRVDFRCERCFSTCAECLRPHAAYGCTACAGDSFLAPFLSPPQTSQLISADESAILEALSLTEMTLLRSASFYREPGLVGSCVSRCPTGYFANETSRICEQCVFAVRFLVTPVQLPSQGRGRGKIPRPATFIRNQKSK